VALWRYIPPLVAPGTVQMAIDAWLLDRHLAGDPPSLRFYTWSPPALSLGYHQRRIPPHWHDLTWNGRAIDLVRRPTGGRGVLHWGDLTYALVMSPPSGNRKQAYRQACEFLVEGWRSLGVELDYGTAGRGYIGNPDCFSTATAADLVLTTGTKWIGSAQLWRSRALLQHGSIQLAPDRDLFARVFGTQLYREGAVCVEIPRAIAALKAAASRCFDATFVDRPLTKTEWNAIGDLKNSVRLGTFEADKGQET